MTTKKGSGGSGRPPAMNRPIAARPQIRPVAGAKPPAIRPVSARVDARPKPPAAPLPNLGASGPESDGDDDLTNVMDRGPAARRGPPKGEPQRVAGPIVRPPQARQVRPARPARPDIDVVPKNQREPVERTAVMPNAPARPDPRGRVPPATAAPQPPPPAAPSFPPAGPMTMPFAAPLRGAAAPEPAVDPQTTRMMSQAPAQWTPSAPPIAGGRVAHPAPPMGTPPPPNVRVQRSVPPMAAAVPAHFSVPPLARPIAPVPRTSSVVGLLVFAAPLAVATLILAALALV